MQIRFVDAFTDRPFTGNPAAVVLLDDAPFPDDARLQRLAAELNLAETAYARPLAGRDDADWALRWFTPTTEVRLCGHATLATAQVLHTTRLATGTVRFATLSGVLTARTDSTGTVTLDFPTAPLTPLPTAPEVSAALGTAVTALYDTGPNLGDLLVELSDEQTVRALTPDLSAVAKLRTRGVIVTAAARPHGDYDYVSRFFAPAVGVAEDPVTGSAHTALAPLWSARLGDDQLTGLQVSPRTGRVQTTLRGDRTLLTGGAVHVMTGELHTAL